MTLCTHCKLTTYLFHCIFRGRSLHIPPFRLNSRHCVSSAHWARHSFLRWRCSPQRICLAKGKHSKRFTIDSFLSARKRQLAILVIVFVCLPLSLISCYIHNLCHDSSCRKFQQYLYQHLHNQAHTLTPKMRNVLKWHKFNSNYVPQIMKL